MGDSDPNPQHYVYMSPHERETEYAQLKNESKHPGTDVTPEKYFRVIARFGRLEDAIHRAELEEPLKSRGSREPSDDQVSLRFIQNDYVNATNNQMINRANTQERIDKARSDSGVQTIDNSHIMPGDPLTPKSWALVYFAGLLFAFGHFYIRNKNMGGNFLLISDLRFWLWSIAWLPGVFRYPTPIDIRYQLQRARRFVTFIISTCLPLTAAACAGKKVKTEPDERRADAAHTLRLNASTTTWPKYVGVNGAVFHASSVQQTTVNLSFPRGLYAGVWDSVPLGDRGLEPNFGREIDFFGGWNGQIHGFNLNTQALYVGVTPIIRYRGDVLVLSTTVSRDLRLGHNQVLGPYLWLAYNMPTVGDRPRQGNFYHEGIRWHWSQGMWSVGANAELMHDSGAAGFSPGYFARGGASIGRTVNKHLRAEIPLQWSVPLSRLRDGRCPEVQAGLTLSVH